MENRFSDLVKKMVREQRTYRIGAALIAVLAVTVFLATTGVMSHRGEAKTITQEVFACPAAAHTHTDACYTEAGVRICGEADFLVHTHDDTCLDEAGQLRCTLPELPAHVHTEECYGDVTALACGLEEVPGHIHGQECYTQPELICGQPEAQEHFHTAECYAGDELTCTLAETPGHTHMDDCYIQPMLICGEEELGHVHTDACRIVLEQQVLLCENRAVLHSHHSHHAHSEACLDAEGNTVCGLEDCYDEAGELICGQENCYDAAGALVCTQDAVQEHIHGAACFETVIWELPDEESGEDAPQDSVMSIEEIAEANVDMALTASGLAEVQGDSQNGTWTYSVRYVGESIDPANPTHVEKTNDFQLKYQMQVNASFDIQPNQMSVRIPAVLLTDRYDRQILPYDIAVPKGTPDAPVPSRNTPINYYEETDESGTLWFVFFNYKTIKSGHNEAWQVYYKNLSAVQLVDESRWTLPSTASMKDVPTANGLQDQTKDGDPLTGHLNTGVTLNKSSVHKSAFYEQNNFVYTPDLYTPTQVRKYAPNVPLEQIDCENYVYAVWHVECSFGFTQACRLYLYDAPSVKGVAGEIVDVTPVYRSNFPVAQRTQFRADSGNTCQFLLETFDRKDMESSANEFREYYVVTRYPAGTVVNGTQLDNTVTFCLHPVDDKDPDQEYSASGSFAHKDFKWEYRGDIIGVYKYTHGDKKNWNLNSWSAIYSYTCDVNQNAQQHDDLGMLNFRVFGAFNGHLLTWPVVRKNPGELPAEIEYKPSMGGMKPNTWIENITTDDFLFAYVDGRSQGSAEPALGQFTRLTQNDYYFATVNVSQTDRQPDWIEGTFLNTPTSDEEIAATGGCSVDRALYIYAMFGVDKNGSRVADTGYTDDCWELVKTIPWDGTGTFNYDFTDEELAREPYRVKAVHNSVDRTWCNITVNAVIRHDSPVFNNWFAKDDGLTISVQNLGAELGSLCQLQPDGTVRRTWQQDQREISSYTACDAVQLADFTRTLYRDEKGNPMLAMRAQAANTLLPLTVNADARKSADMRNDPIHGQYLIEYSLQSQEAFLVNSTNDIELLEKHGHDELSTRKSVIFYDLLPPNVQYDPSAPVTVERLTSIPDPERQPWWKGSYSNAQMDVNIHDPIPDWRGTGRMLLVFEVSYDGADPSGFSYEHWFTGYKVTFGAYCLWEDAEKSLEIPNIAAYMPGGEDTRSLIAKPGQAANDDGVILPESLAELCAPFTAVDPETGRAGDLNGKNGTTEQGFILYMQDAEPADFALSSSDGINKLVKADADIVGTYDVYATVEYGKTYSYRLTVTNNDINTNSALTHLVIYDKLEVAAADRWNEEHEDLGFPTDTSLPWKGTFLGVEAELSDGSAAENVTVYYNADVTRVSIANSQQVNQRPLASDGWMTQADWTAAGHTLEQVQAVAVDFGDYMLHDQNGIPGAVTVTIHMRAPQEDPDHPIAWDYAYNNASYSCERNLGTSYATRSTVIGDTVKVSLREGKQFEIVKQTVGAPTDRRGEEFTFTVYKNEEGKKTPYTYQMYDLYELTDGVWVMRTDVKFATDAAGQLKLMDGQKAVFRGQGGEHLLTAEESVASIYWTPERVVSQSEDGTTLVHTFVNTWTPVLYLQKELTNLSRYDDPANYVGTRFLCQIQRMENGEWVNAAGLEYGTVNQVNTSQYSAPDYTREGFADANGVISIQAGRTTAVRPGMQDTLYRIREVSYAADGSLIVPDASGKLAADGWYSVNAVQQGTLASFGSLKSIANMPETKYVYVEKALQQAAAACTHAFAFRLLDGTGAPIPGVEVRTYDSKDAIALDFAGGNTALSSTVTDAAGGFTVRPGQIVRLMLNAETVYRIVECDTNPDYTMRNVTFSRTKATVTEGGKVTGFEFSLKYTDRDGTSTFTNEYLRRDLKVTKQVLTTDGSGSGERFEMTLQYRDGDTWKVKSEAAYQLVRSSGAVADTGETDENGKFILPAGMTAVFPEIGRIGEAFRVLETPVPLYPQLAPANNGPMEAVLKDEGYSGTIINGSAGMLMVHKTWTGLDPAAQEWLNANPEALGIYVSLEIRKPGETDFRPITADDACKVLRITPETGEDGTVTYRTEVTELTQSVLFYEDPTNTTLVLYSTMDGWKDCAYRITERGLLNASDTDPHTGSVLSADGTLLLRMESTLYEGSGIVAAAPVAELANTIRSEDMSWVYKYLFRGSQIPDEDTELVWRLERYTSSGWIPAAGVEYVVSYQNTLTQRSVEDETGAAVPETVEPSVLGGTVFTTDSDGRIVLTGEGLTDTSPYELAVGFFVPVKVGAAAGTQIGEYRVVEVADQTDPAWGKLIGYAGEGGSFTPGKPTEDPIGFVNSCNTRQLKITKQMTDGELGVGPFGFKVWQYIGNDKLPAAGVPYWVYDTEGNLIREGVTDANGVLELYSGETAVLEVMTLTRWYVEELVGYPYQLDDVTTSGDPAAETTVTETGAQIGIPSALLKPGRQITFMLKTGKTSDYYALDSKVLSVTFGYTAEYADRIVGVEPLVADAADKGTILMYRVPTAADPNKFDVYILSDYPIRANPQSEYMFSNNTALTRVHFGNFSTTGVKQTDRMFQSNNALASITGNIGSWDMTQVTNTCEMFQNCYVLTTVDTKNWELPAVTNAEKMFFCCYVLGGVDTTSWGLAALENANKMFSNCRALSSLDTSGWTLAALKDAGSMFYDCENLQSLNTSRWTLSALKDASNMFKYCEKLNGLDATSWGLPLLENANSMFANCYALSSLDASRWDLSSVKNAGEMFSNCRNLQNLNTTGWKLPLVENTNSMFTNCGKLSSLDTTSWDLSAVKNASAMFANCSVLNGLNTSGWKLSALETATRMFGSCKALSGLDASGWNMSAVTTTKEMFSNCSALDWLNVSGWDVGAVTTSTDMFKNSAPVIYANDWKNVSSVFSTVFYPDSDSLQELYLRNWTFKGDVSLAEFLLEFPNLKTVDISGWDITNVTSMRQFVKSCKALTSMDVSNMKDTGTTPKDFALLFGYASNLETITGISTLPVKNATTLWQMFRNCLKLGNMNLDHWETGNVTDMSYMFDKCERMTELSLVGWDLSSLNGKDGNGLSYFLNGCTSLETVNISGWIDSGSDNQGVFKTSYMFQNCEALSTITGIGELNVSRAGVMGSMFKGCRSLASLDLRKWTPIHATYMNSMFEGCTSLEEIRLDNFRLTEINPAINIGYMFNQCGRLKRIYAPDWQMNPTQMSVFTGCTSLPGYNGNTNSNYCKSTARGGYFTTP